jgi:23S rRNA pseudouridine1911/1915/1917 synthase
MKKHSRRIRPSILLADAHILAVDKPPRVTAIPGRGAVDLPTLLRALDLIGADENLRVVHRLDRGASGVMVFARTLDAQRDLTEQWLQRTVKKTYLALVQGYVEADGRIDTPLRIDRDRRQVVPDRSKGKKSLTRYRIIERLAGHTLLECEPVTGRLHQIRVHLKSIGHPLAVDPLYGREGGILLSQFKSDYRPSRKHAERPLIDRLTLHAQSLTFNHPATGQPMTIQADLPKDLRAAINQLGRCVRIP